MDYVERKAQGSEAKRAIGRLVSRHVPEGVSLFINIGTTTEAVAQELVGHKNLSVITNNLNVAAFLAAGTDLDVLVAGGLVRNRDGGIIGEATIDFINQFKVDIGIIGISGIDLDGTLLDFDYREVRVAQAIVRNARTVFLCADHSKFGRNAMVRLGHIGEVSALFTDRAPPPRWPTCWRPTTWRCISRRGNEGTGGSRRQAARLAGSAFHMSHQASIRPMKALGLSR